jgi:hypothetical protein
VVIVAVAAAVVVVVVGVIVVAMAIVAIIVVTVVERVIVKLGLNLAAKVIFSPLWTAVPSLSHKRTDSVEQKVYFETLIVAKLFKKFHVWSNSKFP